MRRSIHSIALGCLLAAGAARADWDVKPKLKVGFEERYDDDALLRAQLPDGATGQLMSKLMPQVGLSADSRTFESEGFYAADFFLRHGSGRFTVDHRGGLDLRKELSDRARLDGRLSLWRVSDPTSLPRLGVARTLSPVLYGRGEAGGSYRVTERWTSRLAYRFEGAQVFDGVQPLAFVHAPFLENWYRATRRTDLGLEYRFQYFAFGQDTSSAHGTFAGLRHRLSRQTTFTLQGGPVFYARYDGTASGFLPKVTLELARDGEQLDVAFVVGHDLVGASGFSSAVWADFASLITSFGATDRLRFFSAASYFRNGRAPNVGFVPWSAEARTASQGYAVGVGTEWRFTRSFSMQLTADRLAQLSGTVGPDETEFARNIVALRLVLTPWE